MLRTALVSFVLVLGAVVVAQGAPDDDHCLMRYIEPLVTTGSFIVPPEILDCDTQGYVGTVTTTQYDHGVVTEHDATVVFMIVPDGSSEDSRYHEAYGTVTTSVSGTNTLDGCTWSSERVRHDIPDETDTVMTMGALAVELWSDPPVITGTGMVMFELTVTTRCPTPNGVIVSTFAMTPYWSWFGLAEPVPAPNGTVSHLFGSYTWPGATDDAWTRSDWDLRHFSTPFD